MKSNQKISGALEVEDFTGSKRKIAKLSAAL